MNYSTPALTLAFRSHVSPAAADDARRGPCGDGGLEGDKSHSHVRSAADQDMQQFSNQSSEQFDGGGGGAVHPTREHEGQGLEVRLYDFASFMERVFSNVKSSLR